jgi:hypothetical protein
MGAGYAKEATDLGSAQSAIFFRARLDDPNRVESSDEISFYAHVIFGHTKCCERRKARENARRRHSGACEARTRKLEIPGLVLWTIPE